jgi:Recombination endonuclease VII
MHKSNNDVDGSRRCRDCGEWKPLEQFQTSTKRPSGRGSYCKPCFNKRTQESYAKRIQRERDRSVLSRRVVADGMKYCPDCRQEKALDQFPFNKSDSTGRGGYCKPCHNARGQASRAKHGGARRYHLKRRYGIELEQFHELLAAQDGKCRICGTPDPMHVDHDHLTGRVRGILCFNCNGGLGHFRDDVTTMQRAITYLKETSCQRVLVHPGVYRLLSPRRVCLPSRSS